MSTDAERRQKSIQRLLKHKSGHIPKPKGSKHTPPTASGNPTPQRTHCRSQSSVPLLISTPNQKNTTNIPDVLQDRKYGIVKRWNYGGNNYFVAQFGDTYSEDATGEVTHVGKRHGATLTLLQEPHKTIKSRIASPSVSPIRHNDGSLTPPRGGPVGNPILFADLSSPLRTGGGSAATSPRAEGPAAMSGPESDTPESDKSWGQTDADGNQLHGGISSYGGSNTSGDDSALSNDDLETSLNASTTEELGDLVKRVTFVFKERDDSTLSNDDLETSLNASTTEELEDLVKRVTPVFKEIDDLQDKTTPLSVADSTKLDNFKKQYDLILDEWMDFKQTLPECSFGDLCIE